MMPARRHSTNRAGFTLAELLVATALLSFVMGALYTVTQSTLSAWRSLDHGADPYAEARNAIAVFRHEYENLINDGGTIFEGEDSEITMLVLSEPMDIGETQGIHMMRVRYYLARSREGLALMREEELAEGAVPAEGEQTSRLSPTRGLEYKRGKEFQVASNLTEFGIRYIWLPASGAREAGVAPPQVDPFYKEIHRKSWGFPQAVEITYTVVDPEGRRAPLRVRTAFPTRQSSTRKSVGELTRLQ